MNKRIGAYVRAFVIASCLVVPITSPAEEYFLFTSFRGNGEDGLHLAWSTNGYRWQALNGDRSFLKPQVGADKIMRDPCLAEGPDGTFYLVWTSAWTAEKGKIIGYAHSKNLIAWSEQQAIPLMENEPGTRNIWAPEIFYDQAKHLWLLFWSSTVPGKYAETATTGDDGYNHRFYFDHYAQPHYYGAVRSKDLQHWEDCSKEMSFPAGHRHGTVLRISSLVAHRLLAKP